MIFRDWLMGLYQLDQRLFWVVVYIMWFLLFALMVVGVCAFAMWWEALGRSVQAQIYEPSDWALAQIAAEATNQLLNARSMSAQMLKEVNTMWGDLMVSEASRRRVGMLRVPEQETQETVQIKDYLLKAFELDRGANGNY